MRTLYHPPSLELSGYQKSRHQLILLPKKASLPSGWVAKIPGHLSEHPALLGERGAKLLLHGESSTWILGIGNAREFTPQEAAEWGEHAAHLHNQERLSEVQVHFPAELSGHPSSVLGFLKGMLLGNLRLDDLKSLKPSDSKRSELKKIFAMGPGTSKVTKDDLLRVSQLAPGIAFARELAELPAGTADPEGIVERFSRAIDPQRIELEVWDEKRIRKESMGLLMAVSRGSSVPPRFLIARYGHGSSGGRASGKKGGKRRTLALVGKGVTFDTGGVNLKTGDWKMIMSMKKDMAGAAAVLGAMLAISESRPSVSVLGVAPLTTNSLGSRAVLPGDIVRSYSGKTVEIQNTDAEGRLILADALHYVCEQGADYIVDAATLTGACVIALGAHHAGLFSNHRDFQEQVRRITEESGEPAWPMPMSPRYGEELKTPLADLANMAKSREGGAIHGAKFLENFVGTTPWCHVDIAGTSDLRDPAAATAQVKTSGAMVHSMTALAWELAGGS